MNRLTNYQQGSYVLTYLTAISTQVRANKSIYLAIVRNVDLSWVKEIETS